MNTPTIYITTKYAYIGKGNDTVSSEIGARLLYCIDILYDR